MRNIKRIILSLIAIVLLFTLTMNSNVIEASDFTPPEGNFIVSHKKTDLIPGVTENEIIYNNSSGSNPVSGFVVDVKLGSNVGIMAATTNYNEIGTQTVLGMAEAAENATGKNIIAGINADLNWNGTGISVGPMIVDGKVINDQPRDFFGIKKDGTAILGRTSEYNDVKDDLQQAVTAGMGWLVTDGKLVATSTTLAPRSAVGIRADGSVILMMIEGRAFPRSNGIGLKDLAEIMVSMGAVTAANLDGGGSSTYVAKRPGVGQLEIRSHLSDGRERASISSILVYGEEGDGVFDRAIIDTDADAYTPESTIQFNARGADSGGGPADLPNNLTWELENNDFGAIDNNGLFESNGEEGEVKVLLKDENGRTVGTHSVEILIPDEIEFRASEFSFGFEESNDFGLRLLNNKQELKFKDGDIDWNLELYDEDSNSYEPDVDNRLGTIENNIFTSNKDESIAGRITATVNSNKDLTRKLDIVVGQLPNVIFDFEDDEINDMWTTANANGGEVNLDIVTRDSGEPVRFGDKSLRMDFDFRNILRHPGGAYAALKPEIFETDIELKIPGTPTAIGMWVYATEEVQGIWLRGGIGTDGTTLWKALNFTDEIDGIDWVGWKFITLDFAGNNPPFTILNGQFIRLMLTSNSFGGDTSKKPYGSIYIDDITVIYGYNPEDTKNPIIEEFNIYEDENNKINLKDNNQDVDFNNFTIETSFYDYVDDFTSGIDYDNVSILVDGVNYKEDKDNFYLSETDQVARLQNVYLDDGVHEVKVIVLDNEGNETSITRYITVNTEEESLVYFENDLRAVLDKTHQMVLKAKNIENIDNFDLSFKISNEMKDFEVEFMDGFEGEVEYLNSINILNIKANKTGTTASNEILKINVPISKDIKEGANIRYNLIKGTYDYEGEKETFNSFSFKPVVLAVKAPLVIKTNVVMVGQLGEIYVYDVEDNPVANASVYEVSGSTEELIGETNENGLLITDRYMENVESFRLIAKLDDDISFDFNGQSLDSTGEADGAPFAITHNGIAYPHESKNITWLSNAFADNQDALIRFGFADKFDENDSSTYEVVEGSNEMLVFTGSTTITDNYVINVNNVIVNNLEGGKEYKFQVGNGDVWSEVRTFKTVNKFGDVNFFILGDIQSTNYENIFKHSNAVGNNIVDYDFGIQVGDFVDDAGRYAHWYGVLNAMSNSTIGDFDIVKLLGNHEFYGDPEGDNAKAIFNTPDKKDYYSVEYGVVYIGVLSYDMNRESLIEKLEWMVEDANNSNARWKILVTHQPPYYTNPEGGNELISELLPGYAEQANFDFVISGHDHTYARTRPLTNGEIDTNGGITYIIAGSFGEKGYPVSSTDFNFENVIGGLNHIYLSVEATGEKFQIIVYDASTNESVDGLVREKPFDHEHNYILEGDRLVCYECHYSRPLEGYVGFVSDEEDNIMYYTNGEYHRGLLVLGNNKYFFDDNGHALIGEHEIWGLDTTFDEKGLLVRGGTGFTRDFEGKNLYYLDELINYRRGWEEIEGEIYYFSTLNGVARTGETIVAIGNEYYPQTFDEDGRLIKGHLESTSEGIKYYFGNKIGGWYEIDGYMYYFSGANRVMRTGETTIWEHKGSYLFNDRGQLLTGAFVNFSEGTRYYFGPQENENIYETGFQEIDGNIYYFDENGYLMTGTFEIDGFVLNADENGIIEF